LNEHKKASQNSLGHMKHYIFASRCLFLNVYNPQRGASLSSLDLIFTIYEI